MLFTIRQEPGCSENFTLIISLDRRHITQNPLNTLFSKYRIRLITKTITNHSGTPSTIIFHLFSNIDSIRLNDSSYSAISFFFISASGKILFN